MEVVPDVGPEEGVPLSGGPDALVCLVEDHGVGAHLLQHAHRLNRVLPLRPHLCNTPRQVLRLQEKCQENKNGAPGDRFSVKRHKLVYPSN
jgi:hypothetical protein